MEHPLKGRLGLFHQRSIAELIIAFRLLPIAACLLDREARYLLANQRYADLCNASLDSIAGRLVHDSCPPQFAASALAAFRLLDAGQPILPQEIDFGDRWLLVSVGAVSLGDAEKPHAIALTFTDISDLKRVEAELTSANAKLSEAYGRMEQLAETDALTGLLNRRGLGSFFERKVRRCQRDRRPISVAIVDVDGFKSFNDLHGHAAGDARLREIAAIIQASLRRPSDGAARYGGDEFVLVLPDTPLEGAEHVGNSVLNAISTLSSTYRDRLISELTVSIGIAGMTRIPAGFDGEQTFEALLRRADKALYSAKAAGRNGISVCQNAG